MLLYLRSESVFAIVFVFFFSSEDTIIHVLTHTKKLQEFKCYKNNPQSDVHIPKKKNRFKNHINTNILSRWMTGLGVACHPKFWGVKTSNRFVLWICDSEKYGWKKVNQTYSPNGGESHVDDLPMVKCKKSPLTNKRIVETTINNNN